MSMRANVFALPPGTILAANGDSTRLPGSNPGGTPLSDGLPVGEHDILAVDITVTAVSGTITFFFDRQGADGVWYQILPTAAAFSAPGVYSSTLSGANSASQEFGLVGRLRWALSNGGSATVSASVVGK